MLAHIRMDAAELLAVIPSDDAHARNDIDGKSVFDLPEDSPIMAGSRQALTKLGLLQE